LWDLNVSGAHKNLSANFEMELMKNPGTICASTKGV
jgi:hypothetical protein